MIHHGARRGLGEQEAVRWSALPDRHELSIGRAVINRARSKDSIFRQVLQYARYPAGGARHREYDGEQRWRETDRLIYKARIEIDIREDWLAGGLHRRDNGIIH